MKFQVVFVSKGNSVVSFDEKEVGTLHLHLLRDKFGDVDIALARSSSEAVHDPHYRAEVQPDIAQNISHFLEANKIKVEVPAKALNMFCKFTWKRAWGGTEYYFGPVVDSTGLVRAWVEAGTPLTWDPEETVDKWAEEPPKMYNLYISGDLCQDVAVWAARYAANLVHDDGVGFYAAVDRVEAELPTLRHALEVATGTVAQNKNTWLWLCPVCGCWHMSEALPDRYRL